MASAHIDASPTVLMLISSDFVAARHAALCAKAPQLHVVTDLADCDASQIDALFTMKLPAGIAPRLPNLKLAAAVDQFLENLQRVRSGQTPLHSVDRLIGY
jgi:hypothetical protein